MMDEGVTRIWLEVAEVVEEEDLSEEAEAEPVEAAAVVLAAIEAEVSVVLEVLLEEEEEDTIVLPDLFLFRLDRFMVLGLVEVVITEPVEVAAEMGVEAPAAVRLLSFYWLWVLFSISFQVDSPVLVRVHHQLLVQLSSEKLYLKVQSMRQPISPIKHKLAGSAIKQL